MTTTATPKFRLTRFREGYDIVEVDNFLTEITAVLDARLPNLEVADRITAVVFTPVRLRLGYAMEGVDDHLDVLHKLASQGLSPA